MIIAEVTRDRLDAAAYIHSTAWQASHRAFCSAEFVARHTPECQRQYILEKMSGGSRFFMLIAEKPVGIVSVRGSLIEDLYILPEMQNRGYGTALLYFAMSKCTGHPTLWILENNTSAERLYRRCGFLPTGRRNHIADKLDEIEFILSSSKKE